MANARPSACPAVLPDLVTGIPELDEEHDRLLTYLAALGSPAPTGGQTCISQETIAALDAYARSHFAEEEALMAAYDYPAPARSSHVQEHRAFAAEITALADKAATGHAPPGADVALFLGRWVVRHILDEDRRLAAFIRERPHPAPDRGRRADLIPDGT